MDLPTKRRAFKVFPFTGTVDLEQNGTGMLMNVKNGDRVTFKSQCPYNNFPDNDEYRPHPKPRYQDHALVHGADSSHTGYFCVLLTHCLQSRSQQHQQSRLITTMSETSGVTGMVRIHCVKRWVFASHNTLKSGKVYVDICCTLSLKPNLNEKKRKFISCMWLT